VSNRFFHDGPLGPGFVHLDGPEAHHLTTVRRFAAGDTVTLFNGDGREYTARVVELGKRRVELEISSVDAPVRELDNVLHIACAMPKGDRGDFLIEKLTELGVTDFTPLATERAVVKANDAKTDKLRRAVIEASKQCGRNVLMRVHAPARWLDWCAAQNGRRFVAHPSGIAAEESQSLFGPAMVAIGPEGGFTEAEIQTALAAGWELLSLGPRTLRVETAAIVAAVLVSSRRALTSPAPA
jgi:16S rRNA (uracil1498-N3)-methyltransferase